MQPEYYLIARKNTYAVGLVGIGTIHLLYEGSQETASRSVEQLKSGHITPADFCDSPWQDVPLDRVEGILDTPLDRLARRFRDAAIRQEEERRR
uniref:Uncharacterized protein n=1 Tax=Thermosporothrix sp. COM3 TaxID=2490863 RepID=A0A455SE01_9CHLR|nr:hypothetical protein KTC_00200 [Thermosporothrix sp. COM3]